MTKSARLSSDSSCRRGTKNSAAMRSLPHGLRMGVATTGHTRLGAMMMKPCGILRSFPLRTTNAPRCWSSVSTNWSSKPMRRQRSTAHGTLVMKLSAPHSSRKPSWCLVSSTPPIAVLTLEQRNGQLRIQFRQAMRGGQAGDTTSDHSHSPGGSSWASHGTVLSLLRDL